MWGFVLAGVAAFASFGQVDVRAKQAEIEDARRAALPELEAARRRGIPDTDGSDQTVLLAAKHFCGSTPECASAFLDGRDRLYNLYFDQDRKKAVRKAISVTRDGTVIDWRGAANRAEPIPPSPSTSSYTSRLDCRDWTDSSGYHSECTLQPASGYRSYKYRRY